ncbi:glycoside hydrolase family 36 protein [Lapidilactobacillus bayanensis]|uniref:glycoside hydrolase family 36 protein n=1 Tax=Lapidilactobacillus bayanensis TaxID=2485998 RepID=UPI000F773A36|nr:glycoside hydrolase family 36 protein [Lapidilactobacillus bayanensis]
MELLNQYQFGDMLVCYYLTPTQNVEWVIIPADMAAKLTLPHKQKYDALIQVKLVGDDYPKGFVTGTSMRNSQSTRSLKFSEQNSKTFGNVTQVLTTLTDQHQHLFKHYVAYDAAYQTLKTYTEVDNQSDQPIKLELLSSFSMSNLSPFNSKNSPGNLLITRFRSKWAQEGRLAQNLIEDFQLEPSWKPSGAGVEKYGQRGSMPVRGYFPNAFVTDQKQAVTWGFQLAQPNSWQIELYRIDEDLCLAGGLADRDFGHWLKTVPQNDSFQTPAAYLTVAHGDYHQAAHRLVSYQQRALSARHHVEETEFPVSFNEFCTTWGNPSEQSILEQLAVLKNKGIHYYIIDAGWYADPKLGWEKKMGDWQLSTALFPHGLKTVAETIRAAGMIPGIWFEFETVGRDATVFKATDHLLKRDGLPLTVGDRRFWDMNDPWTIDYLQKEVIDFLRENEIGYLKIDYNENFGIGCDNGDSLGEGARQALAGSQNFIRRIHEQLPDLIIENCSSGGHRMEPSSMALADINSISDDHESLCNPIVSANFLDFSLPQTNSIWAVIRHEDDLDRLFYSLCSTFLGRLCLSGDITNLREDQAQVIEAALVFYQQVIPFLKTNNFERFGKPVLSYTHPTGEQALVFKDGQRCLIVAHGFASSKSLTIQLPAAMTIQSQFGCTDAVKVMNQTVHVNFAHDYQAVALILNV